MDCKKCGVEISDDEITERAEELGYVKLDDIIKMVWGVDNPSAGTVLGHTHSGVCVHAGGFDDAKKAIISKLKGEA